MKKSEVRIGSVYAASISNTPSPVRLDSESPYGGWEATNMRTGRPVRIKTAGKLRVELEKNPATGKWRPRTPEAPA